MLGYVTKDSIAAIKSKKCVERLEQEFLYRKNATNLYEFDVEKYPILKEIGYFPSGLRTVVLQIAGHLNHKIKGVQSEADVIEKVFKLGHQVILLLFIHFCRCWRNNDSVRI